MQSANYSSPLTIQGNTSGEAVNVQGTASGTGMDSTGRQIVVGAAADGAAVAGNPVLVAGMDGTNAQTLRLDANGAVFLSLGGISQVDAAANNAPTLSNSSAQLAYLPVYNFQYNATSGVWDRYRGGQSASATFTPAAASHTNGDVVGGAQTFDLNAAPSSVFEIMSASLLIENATIETTAWTLHLYSVTPPSAIADDAAFDIPSGDRASYLGFISLAQVVDYGASLYIETHNIGKRVQLAASGDLFGYLVNGTTLTPGAVAHTVKLIGRSI